MLIARIIFQTKTPLHCGSSFVEQDQDNAVNRDPYGFWRIQGSSIAGILKSYLKSQDTQNTHIDTKLFGDGEGDFKGASKVWCSDAYLLDFDEQFAFVKASKNKLVEIPTGPFIRDHVRISLKTGADENGGKYDEEIVPPGVKFAFELKLDGWDQELTDDEIDAFTSMCFAFKAGYITLGGKQVSGYGRVENVDLKIIKLDLKDEKDLQSYLNLKEEPTFTQNIGTDIPLLPADNKKARIGDVYNGEVTIPLVADGPILIGGNNPKDLDSDMVFLMTPYCNYESKSYKYYYTIPGSSIRGVLRHKVHDVAVALGLDKDNTAPVDSEVQTTVTTDEDNEIVTDKIVNSIFGFISKDTKGEEESSCGHIECDDVYLTTVNQTQLVQHVAIDRFTGGALNGALFDEAPIWQKGLEIKFKIKFNDLRARDAAIFTQAILDLCEGLAPIGGGVNRGNGVLRLKGIENGLEKALSNIEIDVCHGIEKLNTDDSAMVTKWAQELDKELSNEQE